jgi:hypothetical protein
MTDLARGFVFESCSAAKTFGEARFLSAETECRATDAFFELIGPLTKMVGSRFRAQLSGKQVKTASIADHASLEAGLLAAEVVRAGGDVHIWPHSANVVHHHVHAPADIRRVNVAARSTGEVWAKKFGRDKIAVNASNILPETEPIPAFDPQQPIHIILFAGAHTLGRIPFFDRFKHEQCWSAVLDILHAMPVNVSVKHKSSWETRDWITARAGNDQALRFTNTRANRLKHPNMVFMCISLTSTAIFEGIARGIPGMVVRDMPVRETPYYNPDFVPCIESGQLEPFISSLNDPAAWDELRQRQLIWFERETSWA